LLPKILTRTIAERFIDSIGHCPVEISKMSRNDYSIWGPHLEQFVASFSKHYYWTHPEFLDQPTTNRLLRFAQDCDQKGLFHPAAVGKGDLKQRRQDVRSDKILWVDTFSTELGKLIQAFFMDLMGILRKDFYLPAKRFECHFSKYEKGSRYSLHSDRHIEKPGRLVTCVIYLSDCPYGSGTLTLYDENLSPIRIQPQPGRIAVFDSSMEHEVSTAQSDRWSLTGWIREDLHPGLRF
jgi:SM-20-related protein